VVEFHVEQFRERRVTKPREGVEGEKHSRPATSSQKPCAEMSRISGADFFGEK